MKKIISTENAPKAIGPYSQAVEAGDFLFVSGQIALDPASGKLSVQGLVIAGKPEFQLRVQFFTSTNWDGVSDMLCLDKAMLLVKYHLP